MIIRMLEDVDIQRVLELNEESVHFLSPMALKGFKNIRGESDSCKVVDVDGQVEAFIITVREGKNYESENYKWFDKHYDEFLYIDRVVVSVDMQGKGLGAKLYEDTIEYAKECGVPYVTAEIDIEPPNPQSLEFHKKFGFKEVGKQKVAGGTKVVSLQALEIK